MPDDLTTDDLTTTDSPEVLNLPAPNEGEEGTVSEVAVANTRRTADSDKFRLDTHLEVIDEGLATINRLYP